MNYNYYWNLINSLVSEEDKFSELENKLTELTVEDCVIFDLISRRIASSLCQGGIYPVLNKCFAGEISDELVYISLANSVISGEDFVKKLFVRPDECLEYEIEALEEDLAGDFFSVGLNALSRLGVKQESIKDSIMKIYGSLEKYQEYESEFVDLVNRPMASFPKLLLSF